MSYCSFFSLCFAGYFSVLVAAKLAYILSPQNPYNELKCWGLQFLDSQLIPYDVYYFRDMLKVARPAELIDIM